MTFLATEFASSGEEMDGDYVCAAFEMATR